MSYWICRSCAGPGIFLDASDQKGLENFLHLGIDLAPEGGLGLVLACGYDERSNFFDAVNVDCDFVGFRIALAEPCRPRNQGWFEGSLRPLKSSQVI